METLVSLQNPSLQPLSCWQLTKPLDLYSNARGMGLATQAWPGRCLKILATPVEGRRRLVQLKEDGYRGWIEPQQLVGAEVSCEVGRPRQLNAPAIDALLPKLLANAIAAMAIPNTYLWGGSLGPNFDCSGLVQRLFADLGVWIPRDAYQQERFCNAVAVNSGCFSLLAPGDLIFFGKPQRCSHVGLHLGNGRYLHSSGISHGRNGIGIDALWASDKHPVASHYRAEIRGAGRVQRCHDGSYLP
ncbi:C40 family peptidase [Synechococcus sp. Cruz CV12-2-Slac-r]|uniref:C40 family peptidase n=1 Tax=Synechococcus sp. Cruz CV12-2-Slac-r TaxID=2823748 RepID=UPI0020CEC1F9|nr:C40 family peptidase [Synechococcus sp. Cruz CV12-2-Slac-r]MCP9939966.1 C40 family peptidase [Synechococcus sp. Cruz CV12-2-Slac-r]